MTVHRAGMFRYVDPPDTIALEQCVDAIAACSYPWARCAPELADESDGYVTVLWDDIGQGVTGQYHGSRDGTQNVIVLNTRYRPPNYAFTMLHEAGHMVDDTALRDDQRAALVAKWHDDDEGPWNGRTDPNDHSDDPRPFEWAHEAPHVHRSAYPDGGWRIIGGHYLHRPNEAFADAFVAAFAPAHFAYPRFAHWSTDLAGIRAIVLTDPAKPAPTPPPPAPSSAYPNDAIYRLYRAAFLREPDRAGYDHWWRHYRAGLTLTAIADLFTASPEFRQRYGSLTSHQFVTLLYRNVFDRAPDAGGLAHWLGELAAGHTRGRVLVGFSESTEFVAAMGRIPR